MIRNARGSVVADAVRVLTVAVVLAVALVGAPVGASAETTSPPKAVYADGGGTLTLLHADGTTTSLGVSGEVVGELEDLDDDPRLEVPYVDSNGNLELVDTGGETTTLVSSDAYARAVATGDWDGDGRPAVFFETTNGKLARVVPGASYSTVDKPSGSAIATNGAVGVADYDGDGDRDLLYLGSSSTLKYYDGTNAPETTGRTIAYGSAHSIGAPADFDGDGTPRVPFVDGSNQVSLLAADGTATVLDSSYGAVKTHVAASDVTGDATPEVLSLASGSDELTYTTLNGTTAAVTTADGNTITATAGVGVAAGAALPAPRVSEYAVTNPEGREVRVTFTASERLTDIEVALTGAESATLTEADFAETGDGPYRYDATYVGDTDGNYTATLVTARDAEGVDGADGENGTVTVRTPVPTVSNVTLLGDGDGIVSGNDTVRVRATVTNTSDLSTVTAHGGSLGAGTVTLARQSGDTYASNLTVDAAEADSDGPVDVAVSATNVYDNTETVAGGDLTLDTTAPVPDPGQNRTVDEDTSVGFDAEGSTDATGIVSYTWRFADGTTASGPTAVHTYPDPGTYHPTLVVADAENHTANATRTIRVEGVTESDDTEVVTRTETVRVVETVRVGDDATSDPTDDDTTNTTVTDSDGVDRTTVSVDRTTENSIRTTVRNARPGRTVSIPLPAADGEVALRHLSVRLRTAGDHSLTIRRHEGTPAGLSSVEANRTVRPFGYITVEAADGTLPTVDHVDLGVRVPTDALADPGRLRVYTHADGWQGHGTTLASANDSATRVHSRVSSLGTVALAARQPSLNVSDAGVADSSLTTGGTTRVTATVTNDGTAATEAVVHLRVGGETVGERRVTLPAGAGRRVVFSHTFGAAGDHGVVVTLGGSTGSQTEASAGTVSVDAPVESGLPLAGVTALLGLLGLHAVVFYRSGVEGLAALSS